MFCPERCGLGQGQSIGDFREQGRTYGKMNLVLIRSQMLGFQFFCLFLKGSSWQAGLSGSALSHVRLIIYLLMELKGRSWECRQEDIALGVCHSRVRLHLDYMSSPS